MQVDSEKKGDTNPLSIFESILTTYNQAEESAGGAVYKHYALGNHPVRFRFAGPSLVPFLTPAFSHLQIDPPSKPALTVCFWDTRSTNISPPSYFWGRDFHLDRGVMRDISDDRVNAFFRTGSNTLSIIDSHRNLAIYWVYEASDILYYDTASPLMLLLANWFEKRQMRLIHAAAVGTPAGGALLVGRSGSGKSTTALASLNSPLYYAADDLCLVSITADPQIHCLYSTGKLAMDQLDKLPFLKPALATFDRLDNDKAIFFLSAVFAEKIISQMPLKAILIPRISENNQTKITAASPGDSLKAIAPSTIFQQVGSSREAFQDTAFLVRQVPNYNLEVGRDFTQIPGILLDLLDSI